MDSDAVDRKRRTDARSKDGAVADHALGPVVPKPSPDQFEPPVGWLLGSQLLGGLRRILFHQLYSDRLDHRDWMRGSVLDRSTRAASDSSGEAVYWFDYIADPGDGQRATYSVACLCLSDLYVDGGKVSFDGPEGKRLPRGDFLFVGGDTAYPIADVAALQRRFREPFQWASTDVQAEEGRPLDRRPLVGIPGNHDYYDALDGFNRQLRAPPLGEEGSGAEDAASKTGPDTKSSSLAIDAFYRTQQASYVAVRLPFDWLLLGLDTEDDKLDFRQEQFFRTILDGSGSGESAHPVKKLIVATPDPMAALGKVASSALAKPFFQLRLLPHFWDAASGKAPALADDACRLDLSGNYHHYERYWGSKVEPFVEGRTANARVESYASVVAGGGGAFLHPTHTRLGAVDSECRYPSPQQSRERFGHALFDPHNAWRGGFLPVIAFWMNFLVCLVTFEPEQRLSGTVAHAPGIFGRTFSSLLPSFYGVLLVLAAGALAYLAYRWARWVIGRGMRWSERSFVTWEGLWFLPTFILAGLSAWLPAYVMDAVPRASALEVVTGLAVFVLVLGLGIAGPIGQGAAGRGLSCKVSFAALGLMHAFLQLALGTLLARSFSYQAVIVTVVAILVFREIGVRVARNPAPVTKAVLLGLWLCLAGLVVYVACKFRDPALASVHPELLSPLVVSFFAGVFGIGFLGVWLGWYLAVSTAFGGHTNEAGAVARIDSYKQMIRFCLRRDSITGYVIAVRKPQTGRSELLPELELVDVFQVATRGES